MLKNRGPKVESCGFSANMGKSEVVFPKCEQQKI
jgi:hypothetical protein